MARISSDTVEVAKGFGAIARALAASEDLQTTLQMIVELAADNLDACDFAGMSFVERDRITSPAWSHDFSKDLDALQSETGEGPCLDAIKEHEVFTTGNLGAEQRWPNFARRANQETGVQSVLSLRLFIEGDTMGALNLYSTKRDAFNDLDETMGLVFAAHAAVAIRASKAASDVITLQRHMLPEVLPKLEAMSLAVRYVPASEGGKLGGDWYDAVCLPDGRLTLTIGDVGGHGLGAAGVMGQLRNALRGYTIAGFTPPQAVGLLSRLLTQVESEVMATLCHLSIDPVDRTADGLTVHWTNAGHPPPLRIDPDGSTQFLIGKADTPVGQGLPETYGVTTVTVPFGSTLFLYSDGLVERRGESIDDGFDRLERAASVGPSDLEAFCDYVIAEMIGDASPDDVALLALRTEPV